MNETQELPLWIIPLFPIFFAAMWFGITGALGALGGWGELARLYREPADMVRAPVQRFSMGSVDLRRGTFSLPMNYSNCVVVEISAAGLHLRTWLPFRFRHPPLLIPWSAMERVQTGTFLFWRVLTISPRGVGTRMRLYGGPARAVEQVWRQAAERAGQPVAV
ncbi:MAG TPA: hypothetical protein VFT45_20925 [Longimicrobium sp.]|nr:hypothetical protein [Longimicrobium sp.]